MSNKIEKVSKNVKSTSEMEKVVKNNKKPVAKKPVAKKPTEKHSVPKIETEKPQMGQINLDNLVGTFGQKTPVNTPQVKKEDRPSIKISEDIQKFFIDFSAIKEISKIASENEKTMNRNITHDIFESYLDVLWQTKTQPQNPSIKCYDETNKLDATGLFTVSTGSRIKINMPTDFLPGETCDQAIVRSLVELGIDEETSQLLVSKEVSFVPEWRISFTDLLRGVSSSGKITPSTSVQKNAAGQLFLAIQGQDCSGNALSLEDRVQILSQIDEEGWSVLRDNLQSQTTYVPSMVDGDRFLDRVCNYANSREELGNIMTVFKPVLSLRSVAFAVSDSSSQHEIRLLEKCKELIEEGRG